MSYDLTNYRWAGLQPTARLRLFCRPKLSTEQQQLGFSLGALDPAVPYDFDLLPEQQTFHLTNIPEDIDAMDVDALVEPEAPPPESWGGGCNTTWESDALVPFDLHDDEVPMWAKMSDRELYFRSVPKGLSVRYPQPVPDSYSIDDYALRRRVLRVAHLWRRVSDLPTPVNRAFVRFVGRTDLSSNTPVVLMAPLDWDPGYYKLTDEMYISINTSYVTCMCFDLAAKRVRSAGQLEHADAWMSFVDSNMDNDEFSVRDWQATHTSPSGKLGLTYEEMRPYHLLALSRGYVAYSSVMHRVASHQPCRFLIGVDDLSKAQFHKHFVPEQGHGKRTSAVSFVGDALIPAWHAERFYNEIIEKGEGWATGHRADFVSNANWLRLTGDYGLDAEGKPWIAEKRRASIIESIVSHLFSTAQPWRKFLDMLYDGECPKLFFRADLQRFDLVLPREDDNAVLCRAAPILKSVPAAVVAASCSTTTLRRLDGQIVELDARGALFPTVATVGGGDAGQFYMAVEGDHRDIMPERTKSGSVQGDLTVHGWLPMSTLARQIKLTGTVSFFPVTKDASGVWCIIDGPPVDDRSCLFSIHAVLLGDYKGLNYCAFTGDVIGDGKVLPNKWVEYKTFFCAQHNIPLVAYSGAHINQQTARPGTFGAVYTDFQPRLAGHLVRSVTVIVPTGTNNRGGRRAATRTATSVMNNMSNTPRPRTRAQVNTNGRVRTSTVRTQVQRPRARTLVVRPRSNAATAVKLPTVVQAPPIAVDTVTQRPNQTSTIGQASTQDSTRRIYSTSGRRRRNFLGDWINKAGQVSIDSALGAALQWIFGDRISSFVTSLSEVFASVPLKSTDGRVARPRKTEFERRFGRLHGKRAYYYSASGDVPAGTVIFSELITPSMSAWENDPMQKQSSLYSYYKFGDAQIRYENADTPYTSGKIAMFIVTDPDMQIVIENPAGIDAIVEQFGGVKGKLNENMAIPLPPARWPLSTSPGNADPPSLYAQGRLYIIAYTDIPSDATLGTIALDVNAPQWSNPKVDGVERVGSVNTPLVWIRSAASGTFLPGIGAADVHWPLGPGAVGPSLLGYYSVGVDPVSPFYSLNVNNDLTFQPGVYEYEAIMTISGRDNATLSGTNAWILYYVTNDADGGAVATNMPLISHTYTGYSSGTQYFGESVSFRCIVVLRTVSTIVFQLANRCNWNTDDRPSTLFDFNLCVTRLTGLASTEIPPVTRNQIYRTAALEDVSMFHKLFSLKISDADSSSSSKGKEKEKEKTPPSSPKGL